jgi:glycosyltransferase involved in cell wall biosynthesis
MRDTAMSHPDLCIVVPALDEADNLPALFGELSAVLTTAGIGFDLLIVDDGSQEPTTRVIREMVAANPNVRAILLSRTFGHQAAISIGLQHAHGDAVAVMDADLQDSPEDLLRLYRCVQDGADVAYAVRASRPESRLKRAAYWTFYRMLNRLAAISIPVDTGDFCVMRSRFAERLNAFPERLRFVRGLRSWLGGRQVAVPVERRARRSGGPKYTIARLVQLAFDGLVSFSYAPLRLASLLGFTVAGMALLAFGLVLYWKVTKQLPAGLGLATIGLSVLLLGGVQLITLGILGEYIGRIFDEVKGRPVAIAREMLGVEPTEAPCLTARSEQSPVVLTRGSNVS